MPLYEKIPVYHKRGFSLFGDYRMVHNKKVHRQKSMHEKYMTPALLRHKVFFYDMSVYEDRACIFTKRKNTHMSYKYLTLCRMVIISHNFCFVKIIFPFSWREGTFFKSKSDLRYIFAQKRGFLKSLFLILYLSSLKYASPSDAGG